MASGCPVVTSLGTSLEEVGDEAVFYADPFKVENIAQKFWNYYSTHH